MAETRKVALGILVSSVELLAVVRDELARALPPHIALVWQEQHPHALLPKAKGGVPATLTIDVDMRVMASLVDQLASQLARRLEGVPIEMAP